MMKAIMVLIDGLADERIEGLGSKTSLEYSKHENLDKIANEGEKGFFNACPQGFSPDSMACILNLFGVRKAFFPKSRAALELLAHGYSLHQDEVVLRCNLLAVDANNKVVSFNGGMLSKEEMARAADLAAKLDPEIRFIHLACYRNLMIINKKHLKTLDPETYPPHEHLNEDLNALLTDIFASSPTIKNFVLASAEALKSFKQDQLKYIFYPWGLAEKAQLPSFAQMYHLKAAAVCGAEIAKGIALALDMVVPALEGATADIDTDLFLKARAACSLLNDFDFVFVHINGADEAAHRNNYQQKVSFLEKIDQEFLSYLLAQIDEETRVMICADHATSPITGKHSTLAVPFFLKKAGKDRRNIIPPGTGAAEILRYLLSQ